jgi:hypothetical protein
MPDTFVGLVLFVLFLAPGICYTVVREARRPRRELSALRELAAVVLAGVSCNLIAGVLLAIIRATWPSSTPDVGDFVKSPATHFANHFAQSAEWGVAFLLTACVIGILLGLPDVPLLRGPIQFRSAWYIDLHHPEQTLYCGCHLEDGSWIGGYLSSFNTDVEDKGDRDLILTRPVYRGPSSEELYPLEVGSVIISARRLMFLSVTELAPIEPDPQMAETLTSERR